MSAPNAIPPHIVLVNLGTPTAPTPAAVREFLAEFLSDPAVVDWPRIIWRPVLRGIVLRRRPIYVAEQYASIWTDRGSPLRASTEDIVAGLKRVSSGRFTVDTAYRYGEPSIATALGRAPAGARILVAPLFPQRTDATTGTVYRLARSLAATLGLGNRVEDAQLMPAAPGYVEALAARFRDAAAGAPHPPEHIVISFHGIPARYDRREQGLYVRDCQETTRAFLSAIEWPAERATLAYQSKFGPEKWLTPSTAGVFAALPARGIRHIAVITPGFVTDGLETIEEIGIRGRETFEGAGGESLVRVDAVGDHPAFLEALASLALG